MICSGKEHTRKNVGWWFVLDVDFYFFNEIKFLKFYVENTEIFFHYNDTISSNHCF